MEENLEPIPMVAGEDSMSPRPQNAGAALVSALLPGAGQLMLGEKVKGAVFLLLDAVWTFLFFAPFRLPRFYHAWLSLVLLGLLIAIVASCQAVRSTSEGRRPASWAWLAGTLPLAIIVPLLAQGAFLKIGGFRIWQVPSTSMERTIQNGDLVMADMHYYRSRQPSDGDLILFRSPNTPGLILIKRVIAKQGDTISSVSGDVTLNGRAFEEDYVEHTGEPNDDMMNFGPLKIPPHKLFVMGDNRDVSLDSRTPEFGLIDESAVLGKALYIFTPAHDRAGERLH